MKPSLNYRRLNKHILATGAASLIAGLLSAHGQIVLSGIGVQVVENFASAPLATSWSRSNANFGTGSGTITNNATADTAVNSGASAVTIANTSTVLGPGGAALAGTNVMFRHFTNGYVGTASTTGDGSILMARLSNTTGSTITTLNLGWDLTLFNNSVVTAEDAIVGHRLYFSLNGTAWTPVTNTAPSSVNGNFGFISTVAGGPATRTEAQAASISLGAWASGTPAYLIWLDDNGVPNPDGQFALDNVSFTGLSTVRQLIYNLSHSEPGTPDGALSLGGSNYWLNAGNPAALAAGDEVIFSQPGSAVIDVPANISVLGTKVTAPSGTYTIGGAGAIASPLEKSGNGTLALTSANSFGSVAFNGGKIQVSAAGALGSGVITMGAAGTLENAADYTLNNVVGGTGTLTKLGAGTLTIGGANTHAGTTISAGNAVLTGSLPNNHALTVGSGTSLRVTGTVGTGATSTIAGRVFGTGTVNGTTTISSGGVVESGAFGVGNLTFQNLNFAGTAMFNTSLSSSITVSALNGLALNGGNGSVTLNIVGNPAVGTTYSLINYDGAIGGAGFAGITLGTQPNRIVAVLSNNAGTTTIEYTVNGTDFPVWSGALNGAWALGVQGGAENWVLGSNAALSTEFRLSDNVVFSDQPTTDQVVTINGSDVTPASVTFNNSVRNYTLSGANGITGNAAVVKSGTATVTISNTNSFAGAVSVTGGTLRANTLANSGTNSALGSGTTINLDGGGTLEYSGATPGVTNRAITVNNVVGGGGGTIRTTDTLTLSGAISGAGSLTKAGSGRVVIGGAVSGATTVAQGVLEIGAGANVTGTVTVDSGADLEITNGAIGLGSIVDNSRVTIFRTDVVTFTSNISGSGQLIMNGSGTVTLGGAAVPNTYTGLTHVLQGVLVAGKTAGTNAIGGDLLIDGGSFRYSVAGTQNEIPDSANITVNSGSFGDVLNAGPLAQQTETVNNVTVNGGTFGSLRSGTATPLRINGTLSVGAAGTVLFQRGGGISANAITAAAGAVFNFDGGSTTGATAAAVQDSRLIVGPGGLSVTDGTFNFNAGPSGSTASTSNITGSRGSRLQLNGTFTSVGTTNILRAAASLANIAQARSAIDLDSGARTFDITGTLNLGTKAAPLTVRDGNPALVVADPIPAPGSIIKVGTGVLNMPGDQQYTGTTTINGGTLAIDGNLSTSSITINSGGTLSGQGITGTTGGGVTVHTGGAIIPGVAGAGTLTFPTLTLGTVAADRSALTFRSGATIAVSGNDGFVINSGAGNVTVNLAGSNPGLGSYVLIDYAGLLGGIGETAFVRGTMPNRVGTVSITNDAVNTAIVLNILTSDVPIWTGKVSSEWSTAALAAPKNWGIVGSAATTDYLELDNVLFDDTAQTTALTISGGDITPNTVRFNNSTKDYTLAGPNLITGAATFVKDGTGTVAVSGANTFTGSVTLNAGTTSVDMVANVGVGQPLGTGATLTFNGGTLQYTGFSESTNRAIALTSAGTVKTDNTVTLAGLITGAGRLTKTGFGTTVLTAANVDFNGGLTIKEGTVQFAAANGVGGLTQIVTLDGGTLDYTGTAGLNWTDATALQTRGIAVASFGTIRTLGVVGAGLNLTRAGSITGAGPLTKDGVGTLRISANNVGYTGNWSVNGGGLEVGSVNALGNGTVTVESGGILVKVQTATVGAGTTLPNNITLNGGRLTVRTGNFGAYGGSVNVTAPSNVSLSSYTSGGSLDVTISGPLSGNQPLTVVGVAAGTRALILTNPATNYTGQYIVTAAQGLTAQPPITGNPLGSASISLDSGSRLGLFDDGTGNNGTVVYGNNLTITGATASEINVNRSGATATRTGNTIQLGTLTTTAGTLNVTGGNGYFVEFLGTSDLGLAPTINATTGNISFEGDVTAGGLVKTGVGILNFDEPGTVNIPGLVDVQAGTLSVNSVLNSGLDISVSGTLSGSGTITNNVVTTATGIIAPGNSAGILDIGGNVTLVAGSSFNVELAHGAGLTPVAGTDYDQLNVGTIAADGTVDITGATLNINAGVGSGFIANDLFFIIVNDGNDAITGTFANAPTAGSFITASGVAFEISYDANFNLGTFHGGNDVALLVPEPGSAALLLGGLAMLAGRRRRKA